MKNGLVLQVNITDLNENDAKKVLNTDVVCYDIMHGERKVDRNQHGWRSGCFQRKLFCPMIFIWKRTKSLIHASTI